MTIRYQRCMNWNLGLLYLQILATIYDIVMFLHLYKLTKIDIIINYNILSPGH